MIASVLPTGDADVQKVGLPFSLFRSRQAARALAKRRVRGRNRPDAKEALLLITVCAQLSDLVR